MMPDRATSSVGGRKAVDERVPFVFYMGNAVSDDVNKESENESIKKYFCSVVD
jgi:hypothetical protein